MSGLGNREAGAGQLAGSDSGVRRVRKVQYGYYDHGSDAPHPVIRIAGKYLEKFGFRIGEPIEVEIADGKIMVRRLAEPDRRYVGGNDSIAREESGDKGK